MKFINSNFIRFPFFSEDYKVEKLNNICFIHVIVLSFNVDVEFIKFRFIHICYRFNRVFLKVDDSGNVARIVLG